MSYPLSILDAPAVEPETVNLPTNPIDQAREVFREGNRFAALFAVLLGGFVPVATYTLVHYEVGDTPLLWVLVGGGLVYSAISVYSWAKLAFNYTLKALGFVLLLEGIMTFSHSGWLSLCGLAILIFLNAVSAAVVLQIKRTAPAQVIEAQPQKIARSRKIIAIPQPLTGLNPAQKAWATRRARAAA